MFELVKVLNSVRTVVSIHRDERSAGQAAEPIILGPDADYDEIRIDDTTTRVSKVVAVAPAATRAVQSSDGRWVLVKGESFATQQEAEAEAAKRSRR